MLRQAHRHHDPNSTTLKSPLGYIDGATDAMNRLYHFDTPPQNCDTPRGFSGLPFLRVVSPVLPLRHPFIVAWKLFVDSRHSRHTFSSICCWTSRWPSSKIIRTSASGATSCCFPHAAAAACSFFSASFSRCISASATGIQCTVRR